MHKYQIIMMYDDNDNQLRNLFSSKNNFQM